MNQSHSPERNRCQGNRGIPEQEASPTARICRESPLTKGSRIILFFGKGAMRLSLPPARTGVGGAHQWVKGLVPCGFLGRSPKALLFSYNLANYKTHSSLFLLHRSFIAHLTLPARQGRKKWTACLLSIIPLEGGYENHPNSHQHNTFDAISYNPIFPELW